VLHYEINISCWQASWFSMEDPRPEDGFEEIIGDSSALRQVLKLAMKVAASDAPVLILGEAGSGRELMARAIHRISDRRNESFVKVNCVLAPAALGALESELFGLKKTSPEESRKNGQVEFANKGTLFLDEIAHLSPGLQEKVLGLMKRREIERPSGARNPGASVRVIATTQYDLGERVANQMFLGDLYDELNAFPIQVPSLRERRDDIPLLAHYFMRKFARRHRKHIETIPAETIDFLTNSDWPGNVRQLENLIERLVIRTEGPVLRVAPTASQPHSEAKDR
jgi:formate hydrogenlyase transcriptional activator